jgi:hypothetical protein
MKHVRKHVEEITRRRWATNLGCSGGACAVVEMCASFISTVPEW